jgi:hypothetical protein
MRHCRILLLLITLGVGGLPCLRADDAVKPPEGFESLFNGKDLTGWKVHEGDMKVWGADKGLIYVEGGRGGWLFTEKEYTDFELRLEFKISKEGNSGVALRAHEKGDPAYAGMEIQILDNDWHLKNLKDLKPVQLTGSIYGVCPPSADATRPIGEWNSYHITAKGRKITIELNGTIIVNANLDDYPQHFEGHPGLKRTGGYLGLQSHSARCEFRNIFVKPL